MKLSQKQQIFSLRLAEFIVWCFENGYNVTRGEAYRTKDQQAIYVVAGKSETMESKHCIRLAQDLNLFIDGVYITDKELYRPLGEKWESLGGTWGGRFGVKLDNYDSQIGWDSNHFEF